MAAQTIDTIEIPPEGAGTLLCYKNYIYMLERNPDYVKNDKQLHELEYPGGKFDPQAGDTDYVTCAIRETREETGGMITLDPKQLSKHVLSVSPANKGVCLFIVELTDDQHDLIDKIRQKLKSDYNSTFYLTDAQLNVLNEIEKKVPAKYQSVTKYIHKENNTIDGRASQETMDIIEISKEELFSAVSKVAEASDKEIIKREKIVEVRGLPVRSFNIILMRLVLKQNLL